MPIDLDFVPFDIPLVFPLFLKKGNGNHGNFAIIRNKGATLTQRIRDQLRGEGGAVYTKEKYFGMYQESVDSHLEKILTDADIPTEKRLSFLHQKGKTVLKEFFARPDSQELCQKTQELVSFILRLTLSEDLTLKTILQMAQQDYETHSHSLQVCLLGVSFFRRLFSDHEISGKYRFSGDLEKVAQGFIYHDLGKSLTDPNILKKAGPLDAAEWEAVKKHPQGGVQLLQELGIRDRDIIHITLYHHERMDGKGYPDGLTGMVIPPIAKVAAIIDAFDAITSRRPYKKAISTFQALTIMRDENAGFYDPELFQHFLRMFGENSKPTDENGFRQDQEVEIGQNSRHKVS